METKQELLEFLKWVQETPRLYQENDGWSWHNLELTNEQLVEIFLNHNQHLRIMTTIQQAKQVLRDNGYCVDNIWHVDDVLQTYDCTTEEAQSVLDAALSSDYLVSEIFSWIDRYAQEYSLTEK